MGYIERMRRRISGDEARVPYQFGHKVSTHEFCQAVGIPAPKLLRKFDHPAEIDLDGLPDHFVLKPSYSSTSKGVLVLKRVDDCFFDSMSKRLISLKEIVGLQLEVFESHKKTKRKVTIVEERVQDLDATEIPKDYKFLAFQGQIGIIIVINRVGERLSMSYFDGEFRPIVDDRIVFNANIAERTTMLPPRNWQRLLNVARRVSVAVPTPCARIDLFDSSRGPLLGEVTLTPGSFYYPGGHTLSISGGPTPGTSLGGSRIAIMGNS